MGPEIFKKMVEVVKVMDKYIVGSANLGLMFEDSKLTGMFYSNELGFCSFGASDAPKDKSGGELAFVDTKVFLDKVSNYVDIFESRKLVRDDFVEFKSKGKSVRITIKNRGSIVLDFWKKGKKLSIESGELINLGSDMEYFIVGDNFYFNCLDYRGRKKLSAEEPDNMKLSPVFVGIFGMDFEIVKYTDRGTYFFDSDLEVFLFSGIEVNKFSTGRRFTRQINKIIKDKHLLVENDEKKIENLIERLKMIRSTGGDFIKVEGSPDGIDLKTDIVGSTFKDKLNIKSRKKFSGYLTLPSVDIIYRFRDLFTKFCTDNVDFMFEGDELIIVCRLASNDLKNV